MWLKVFLLILCYILQSTAANLSTNDSNASHQHKQLPRPYLLTDYDPKIIGGAPIAITNAPWQVSVRLKSYEDIQYGYGHICGASIISQRVILSAAHCTMRTDITPAVYRNPSELTLVMGSVYLYEVTPFTLQFDVLKIVPNPEFNLDTLQNDIALLFIDGMIPINHPTATSIPLNQLSLNSDVNCTVTGWGITESGVTWPVLLGIVVPIVETTQCNVSYAGNITRGMICAGYNTSAGGMDACQGDFGGPLACQKMLAGIVSWGKGCTDPGYPSVYTKISEYRNWILLTNSTFNYERYGGGVASLGVNHRHLMWGILFCVLFTMSWSHMA